MGQRELGPFDVRGRAGRVELKTFSLHGIDDEQILLFSNTFTTADKELLQAQLREEVGHPWAANALAETWEENEVEARRRGLFDLIWHRRARQVDPFVPARDFAGFDVLVDAAQHLCPEVAQLLVFVNGNDPTNPRAFDGPEWWRAWHEGAATRAGGWLSTDEVRRLSSSWWKISAAEVEAACLTALGATYTHPGCWALLSDLGGFFAQCSSENRVVVVEVDD